CIEGILLALSNATPHVPGDARDAAVPDLVEAPGLNLGCGAGAPGECTLRTLRDPAGRKPPGPCMNPSGAPLCRFFVPQARCWAAWRSCLRCRLCPSLRRARHRFA